MRKLLRCLTTLTLLALLVLGISKTAMATTITFSEYPVGTVITNQYQELGVTFSGALSGPPVIANDGAMPSAPVLSPNPRYAGTFNINFGFGAFGVQFDSGYWDTLGSGVIKVYNLSSVLIATLTDTTFGVDHIDLGGLGPIGDIYFDSRADPAGADIDNLQFTTAPEPGGLLLLGSGLGLIGIGTVRRKLFR